MLYRDVMTSTVHASRCVVDRGRPRHGLTLSAVTLAVKPEQLRGASGADELRKTNEFGRWCVSCIKPNVAVFSILWLQPRRTTQWSCGMQYWAKQRVTVRSVRGTYSHRNYQTELQHWWVGKTSSNLSDKVNTNRPLFFTLWVNHG